MWNNNIEETMETSNLVNSVTGVSAASLQVQISDPKGISELCRVCLISLHNYNNSHNNTHKSCSLFVSNGRCAQLWVKVMACAWVQVIPTSFLSD